jgi:peptidoglycan/LPS O-acetylase OafA/YrhL
MSLSGTLKNIYYEKGSIPILDGFRGMAAFLVLLSHVFVDQFKNTPILDSFIIFSGHGGVELFFVLSGFLISYPFWKNYYFEKKVISYRNFYLRRALRVLPLFYISFFFFLLLSMILNKEISEHLRIIPFYIFQVHNFSSHINFLNPPTWTIAVEIHFYLLVSLFFLWKGRSSLKNAIFTLTIILLVIFIYKIWAGTQVNDPATYRNLIYANTFARLDQFITGIFLSLLYICMKHSSILNKRIEKYKDISLITGVFMIVAISLIEYNLDQAGNVYNNTFFKVLYPTLTSLAWGMLLLSGLSNGKLVKDLFSSNILTMLGKLSYSIYLLHVPLYTWLFKPFIINYCHLNEFASALLFIPLIIIISIVTYSVIEKPFLSMKSDYL